MMCHTIRYKQGYIHISNWNNIETIRVCVTPYALTVRCKSVRAAKQMITRYKTHAKN